MIEVRITADAKEQFDRLPAVIRNRVVEIFDRLANWPRVSGAKPLRRQLVGHFRIRTGDWRVVFKPVGQIVWITAVDNRKDVYER